MYVCNVKRGQRVKGGDMDKETRGHSCFVRPSIRYQYSLLNNTFSPSTDGISGNSLIVFIKFAKFHVNFQGSETRIYPVE
jgi:hypothetical protein